jgi:hypothetical protein
VNGARDALSPGVVALWLAGELVNAAAVAGTNVARKGRRLVEGAFVKEPGQPHPAAGHVLQDFLHCCVSCLMRLPFAVSSFSAVGLSSGRHRDSSLRMSSMSRTRRSMIGFLMLAEEGVRTEGLVTSRLLCAKRPTS